MLEKLPENVSNIIVNTGNILGIKEIKQLTGQNQGDELVESLKITLAGWVPDPNDTSPIVKITRSEDTTDAGCCSVERDNLKISVKIFILSSRTEVLMEALNKVFAALKVTRIDSLVLACKLEPSSVLATLQSLWKIVEGLVENNVVTDVGVSDVDTDVFIALFQWAKIKPRIIQINLTVCCVVPPILQEFCRDNNVQLLTHSDPLDILPKPALYQAFAASEADHLAVDWVVRYLAHIQSRGVLQTKGYMMSATRRVP